MKFWIFSMIILCHRIVHGIETFENLIDKCQSLLSDIVVIDAQLEPSPRILQKKIVEIRNDLEASENSSKANNPLNIFRYTKRLTIDVEKIDKKLNAIGSLLRINSKSIKLDKSALSDAVIGLSTLQETYKFTTEDLANGIVAGVKCQERLDPSELLVLGDELIKFKNNLRAVEYLMIGYKTAPLDDDENVKFEIAKKLMRSLKRSKKLTDAIEFGQTVVADLEEKQQHQGQFEPESYHAIILRFFQGEVKDLEVSIRQSVGGEKNDETAYVDPETRILAKACRGEILMNSSQLSTLRCRFATTNSFTKLARFKTEEMSLDPYLVVFYDVVSDNEIAMLEEISNPKFTRSVTVTADGDIQVRSSRVSEVAWHFDESHIVVATISRRIEDMTGLTTETAERLQVQRYQVGGHYGAHYDFATDYETPFQLGTGNRIATVLFYLSDVIGGGATVFPFMNVFIPPQKGSAAFWYNLHSSGEGEYLTRHSGCQVLIGNKLVANKWLHEKGQEFRRKCFKFTSTDEYNEIYLRIMNFSDTGKF